MDAQTRGLQYGRSLASWISPEVCIAVEGQSVVLGETRRSSSWYIDERTNFDTYEVPRVEYRNLSNRVTAMPSSDRPSRKEGCAFTSDGGGCLEFQSSDVEVMSVGDSWINIQRRGWNYRTNLGDLRQIDYRNIIRLFRDRNRANQLRLVIAHQEGLSREGNDFYGYSCVVE